jgi:phosphomannomutase
MAQRPRLNRYSWEGVYSAEFTLDSFRRRFRRLAETLMAHNWSCLIAHDTRFMAGQYARYAYQGLQARGVRVSFCPTPAPFPAVEQALDQKRADTALIVSAGNRPFWYNGMIVLAPLDSSPLLGEPEAEDSAPDAPFPPAPLDNTENTSIDLRSPYLETLRDSVDMDLIRRATLTVFVDPMNGAASGYVPAALGEGGQTKAIEINRETDPLFGRQPPQPTEAGLNRLRKLVKESDSHLGVALSADGRAISVADNQGDSVSLLDMTLLLAQYLNRQYRQRGAIVAPTSDGAAEAAAGIRAWEEASGLKVELSVDPAARIAELLNQDRNSLLVGTTAAGEITLGRYSPSPDATLVALILIESVARAGVRLRALLDEMKGRSVKREP